MAKTKDSERETLEETPVMEKEEAPVPPKPEVSRTRIADILQHNLTVPILINMVSLVGVVYDNDGQAIDVEVVGRSVCYGAIKLSELGPDDLLSRQELHDLMETYLKREI